MKTQEKDKPQYLRWVRLVVSLLEGNKEVLQNEKKIC